MSAKVMMKVDKLGNVTIKVVGVTGPACEELTRELEEALGVVVSSKKTAEYHEKATQNDVQSQS